MTKLVMPIAAVLAIFGRVGQSAERRTVSATLRSWSRPAVLAAVGTFFGLAVRGPGLTPGADEQTWAASAGWRIVILSVAVVVVLVALARSPDVRTPSLGLVMAVLVFGAALAQHQPFVVALLTGSVAVVGVTLIADVGASASRLAIASRYFVFVCLAALTLVAATTLAHLALQSGNTSIVGPAVGLLAVATLTLTGAFPFHVWLPPLVERGPWHGVMMAVGLAQLAGLGTMLTLMTSVPWLLVDFRQETLILLVAISGLLSGALALGEKSRMRAAAHLLALQGTMVLSGLLSRSQPGLVGALIVVLTLGPILLLVIGCGRESRRVQNGASASNRTAWLVAGVGWLNLLGLPPTVAFWGRSLIVAAVFAMPVADPTVGVDGPGFSSGQVAAGLLIVAQVLAMASAVRHAAGWLHGAADGDAEDQMDYNQDNKVHSGEVSSPRSPSFSWVCAAVAAATVVLGLLPAPVVRTIERALLGLPLL